MDTITVRKPDFDFEGMDPLFIEGMPEASHYNNGSSMVLPYLEGLCIRSMRRALPYITDPDLYQEVEQFCRQEAQHSSQHHAFNRALKAAGYPQLPALEQQVKAHYRRHGERSIKFGIAYTVGFESLATHSALLTIGSGMLDRSRGPAGALWKWHLYEELEHRCLAHDVYEHLYGDWHYRVGMSIFAFLDTSRWFVKLGNYLLRQDRGRIAQEYGGKAGRKLRMKQMGSFNLAMLRSFLPTFKPGYDPRQVAMPEPVLAIGEALEHGAL